MNRDCSLVIYSPTIQYPEIPYPGGQRLCLTLLELIHQYLQDIVLELLQHLKLKKKDISLDAILKTVGWKSENTFRTFNDKPIIETVDMGTALLSS